MNIFYEESGQFKVAAIVQKNDATYQVDTQHGKRTKVKANNVFAEFDGDMAAFLENAQALAADIDTDLLWEVCGEEVSWQMSMLFDGMGAMSSRYNETPELASRAYDADRDGFVISGGGSMLVLEEYEHAKARGANILCELTGYGATSDGYDMVQPSGEGAVRCMQMALAQHGGKIDYINAHGTSTPVGDTRELEAIRTTFANGDIPLISSTKSLSGHALGAAGSNEAIYSILMMQDGFVCGSANIQKLDEKAEGMPILRENRDMKLNAIMSNSFGFGGTNATLIFSRV